MARMCKLTDAETQAPVYVNAALVCIVRHDAEGRTEVVFDDDLAVAVAEHLDVAARRLEEAGR